MFPWSPLSFGFRFPLAVNSMVLVPLVKVPPEMSKFPPTFQVLAPAATVVTVLLRVTGPLVNGAMFCVAVPPPELASKMIAFVAAGVQRHGVPTGPVVLDQCESVSEKFPVPPIQ